MSSLQIVARSTMRRRIHEFSDLWCGIDQIKAHEAAQNISLGAAGTEVDGKPGHARLDSREDAEEIWSTSPILTRSALHSCCE